MFSYIYNTIFINLSISLPPSSVPPLPFILSLLPPSLPLRPIPPSASPLCFPVSGMWVATRLFRSVNGPPPPVVYPKPPSSSPRPPNPAFQSMQSHYLKHSLPPPTSILLYLYTLPNKYFLPSSWLWIYHNAILGSRSSTILSTCPAHFTQLFTNPLIRHFSMPSSSLRSSIPLLSILFTPAIHLTQLCSHTCSLCCCLSVRAIVSRPYKHVGVMYAPRNFRFNFVEILSAKICPSYSNTFMLLQRDRL